jgi:hypothetical protein
MCVDPLALGWTHEGSKWKMEGHSLK